MPSQKLSLKELVLAKIYLNQFGEIFAKAPVLLVVSSSIRLSPDVSGLANIIPFVLEGFYVMDDVGPVSLFRSCSPPAAGSLGPIIPLALESFLGLGSLGPGLYPGPSASFPVDDLGLDIPPGKRSFVIVGSLTAGNCVAFLVCPGWSNSTPAAGSGVLDPAVGGLRYTDCIAQWLGCSG